MLGNSNGLLASIEKCRIIFLHQAPETPNPTLFTRCSPSKRPTPLRAANRQWGVLEPRRAAADLGARLLHGLLRASGSQVLLTMLSRSSPPLPCGKASPITHMLPIARGGRIDRCLMQGLGLSNSNAVEVVTSVTDEAAASVELPNLFGLRMLPAKQVLSEAD